MFASLALNRTFPGKVARFSVDVREDTRTMHTEVDVPNPERVLMPGLYAEADVSLEHRDDIPVVPLQAINHEGDKTTVFVVNRDGEVEDRPVMLGIQTATDAEVISGLTEGEQVVVSDRSGLKTGRDGSSAGRPGPAISGCAEDQSRGPLFPVRVSEEQKCQVFRFAIRISSSSSAWRWSSSE